MQERLVTVVGVNHYLGLAPFTPKRVLRCTKEPNNMSDKRAIRVEGSYVGKLGYIANSAYTVVEGTISAKHLRKEVKKVFYIQVLTVEHSHVICKLLDMKRQKGEEMFVKA